MRSALLALALGFAALGVAAPAHARAPTCEAMAEVSAASGESVAWASPIAAALVDAEARLDLRAPARVAYVDVALAGAWYCAADDVVYLSRPLVDWAWLGRAVDGRDFLGFVVAHELAHRRFDPGDGALAEACPEVDVPREARADRRAAFLLALARDPERQRGFSPFSLARRDGIASFFSAELGWAPDCAALTARVQAVNDAVGRMAELGRRYDLALTLALAGRDEPALALLGALDAAQGGEWDAMPEVQIVEALVHLERAERAGWCPDELARAPLDPSPCTLRCAPSLPHYPRLAPRDAAGDRQRATVDRAAELATVRTLLAAAARGGFASARMRGLAACVAYAEGAPDRALASAEPPQRELFELQRFLLESPDPVASGAWSDALRDLLADLPSRGDVARVAARWLDADDRPPERDLARGAGRAPDLAAWVELAPCTATAGAPLTAGWVLRGDEGCAAVARPGRAGIIVRAARLTGLSASLEAWRARCELTPRGRLDDGVDVYAARCPSWDGPNDSWLLVAGGTLRATRLTESEP
ncbi:MAG: hypothetical protein U1F43_29640 [Myxococcota bacterium]